MKQYGQIHVVDVALPAIASETHTVTIWKWVFQLEGYIFVLPSLRHTFCLFALDHRHFTLIRRMWARSLDRLFGCYHKKFQPPRTKIKTGTSSLAASFEDTTFFGQKMGSHAKFKIRRTQMENPIHWARARPRKSEITSATTVQIHGGALR